MGKALKIIIAGIIIIVFFLNCTQKKDENPVSYTRDDVIGLWIRDPIPMILDYRIIMNIQGNSNYGLYADTASGDTVFIHEGTWSVPNDSIIQFIGTNCQKDTSGSGLIPFACSLASPIDVKIDIQYDDSLKCNLWPVTVGDMKEVAEAIGIDLSQIDPRIELMMEKRP